jgi:hypothetical protein
MFLAVDTTLVLLHEASSSALMRVSSLLVLAMGLGAGHAYTRHTDFHYLGRNRVATPQLGSSPGPQGRNCDARTSSCPSSGGL